jgi:lipopolysaccharide export system ATP-binding protein
MPLHLRALKGIGYLPQEASIFKDLSVEDNLMVAAQVSIKDKLKQEQRILELLDMFNIEPIRYRKGISLSGGERRRVEIARALVNEPKLILADEPTGNLDPLLAVDILGLFEDIHDTGTTVIFATHDRTLLDIRPRRVVVLDNGQITDVPHGLQPGIPENTPTTSSVYERLPEGVEVPEREDELEVA